MKKIIMLTLAMLASGVSMAKYVVIVQNGNGSEYKIKEPTKTGTSYGNWSNWVNESAIFNCGTYSPDASTVDTSSRVNQTASCKQKQKRSRDVFDVYSNGTTTKTVENENKNIDVTDSKSVFGCITRYALKTMISNGDDVTQVNTGCITDFSSLFFYKKSFNQDISGWDVSSGTNFAGMFFGSSSFNQDIGGWDVSKGTNLSFMFNSANAFNQDVSGWDV
ncbi:BspA family leucine-rich repeat surface protein, partial [Vibrio splendidus]